MTNLTFINYRYIAALIWSCFFLLSCENKIEDVEKFNTKKISIERGKNIESFLSQGGVVKAKLMAPVMLRYQFDTPKVEFPNSLLVDFYDSAQTIESKLSAKYGRYLENENKVYLRDSVVVFNIKGDTLHCNDLYWDQQKAIFYTEKNVIITKPGEKYHGTGLTADQNFKFFTIKKVRNSYLKVADSTFLAE